jgi:Domain of unknown function (DUF6531)
MTAYFRASNAVALLVALSIGPFILADCEPGTPAPSVSISYVPLDVTTGDGKLSIPYSFPNMTNPAKRQLTYYIDGNQGLTIGAPQQSGVWEPDVDMTCWTTGTHTLKVDAISICTPQLKSSASNSATANTKPDVSIEYTHDALGHGTISVPYEFPNTSASGQRQLTLFIDGVQNITIAAPHNTGTWDYPWDITCWSGTHEFGVVAHACGNTSASHSDDDTTTVTADPKPSVSLSFSAQNGGVASIPYEFPLTATPQQRSVALYRDGALFGFAPSPVQNGTWSPTVGSCWKELRVVARACGGGAEYTTEKTFKNPLDQLKPISVSLLKTGVNGNTSIIQATVTWNNATPGSTVSVNLKNWIDGKGQSYGGGLLKAFANVPVSKTETFTFNAPSGARQLSVVATVQTPCAVAKDDASIACDACDATGNPVYWSDGNMRLTDGEPLPPIAGHALVRSYDSEEQVGGIFGRGWTSVFERRLIAHTDGSVSIVTGTNEVVTFRSVNGAYRQTWPQSVRALGTLVYDSGAGRYTYRAPGSAEVAIFRASDGRLIVLRDTASAREAVLAYDAQGRPATFTDSVTETTWILALDAQRRVTSISVAGHPELDWTYTYDAGNNLLTVLAPGAAPWRTYEYLDDRMTASRDALGHLIESHSYDAEGYATSSTGDIDEIESIDYGLPGSTAGDRVTRITYKTGAVSEYTLRPIGGAWRPVKVAGGCASCGTRDATYVRDARGRVVRQQGGDGYIIATTYANDVVASVQESLKPVGCDPQTDPQRCRLDPDALAAATLEPTSSSVTTTYEYADPLWPDRPTKILRPSIVVGEGGRSGDEESVAFREEWRFYHATTGALTRHEHRARRGDAFHSQATTWTFYEGTSNAPTFDPGGVFQSSWLSLPQPVGLIRTVNGPRTDAQDITSYVYYPIDGSVPALLRSRLAAVRNAAGQSHASSRMTSSETPPASLIPMASPPKPRSTRWAVRSPTQRRRCRAAILRSTRSARPMSRPRVSTRPHPGRWRA